MTEAGRSETVRDDRDGTLSCALRAHVRDGELLLERARDIYDVAALARWREGQRAWRRASARTLQARFEQETLAEFLRAGRRSGEVKKFEELLQSELRAMTQATELLRSLLKSLDLQGVRRAFEHPRPSTADGLWGTERP